MLYLEDYLEMVENLPMEMRDRFTEMREMDLQVQNAMDSLEDRVKSFFKKCSTTPSLKQDWKDEHFSQIKDDYGKALEDADEKVQLANQIYDLVERNLRKLDQELSKFKMELEADNAGITEMLEKRSLEMDIPPPLNNHRAEKRKYHGSQLSNHLGEKRHSSDKVLSSIANDSAREPLGSSNRPNSAASSPASVMFESASAPSSRHPTPSLTYSLGEPASATLTKRPSTSNLRAGAGSNAAIAAAASKAIGATLEMQQGRRTASLKASYEAMARNADLTKEFNLGAREGSSAAGGSSTPAVEPPVTPTPPAKASRTKKARQQQQQQQQQQQALAAAVPAPEPTVVAEEVTVDPGTEETTQWQIDPNEPRYCICNDVSYGEMVGCDNDDCPIEWFHYGCVGLTQAPKGKWFCPQCTAAMKRRGRK